MSNRYRTRKELLAEVEELRRHVAALQQEIPSQRQVESSCINPPASPDAVTAYDAQAWERIFNAMPIPVMLVSMDLRIDWMNKAMAELWGFELRESIGMPCYKVIHGKGQPPEWCPHNKVLQDGKSHSAVIEPPHLGLTLELRTSPLVDYAGKIVGSVHTIIDLTKQKLVESALAESEETFRELLAGMNEGFGVRDANGLVTYVNDKLCKMWGYSREEIVGRPVEDFLDEENKRMLRTEIASRRDGAITPYELEWTVKGGARIPTLMAPKPIFNREGTYVGSFAVITDLTDQKRAEKRLRESEERYKNLVDLSPDGIHVQVGGRVAFANETMASLLGMSSPADLIGKEVLDFIHPDFRDSVRERIYTTLSKSEPVPLLEEKYVRADGTVIDVEVAASPLMFRGQPAAQVVVRDISSRKRSEEQLRSALKEKEVLLQEIHHRVKNNLQVISSLLKLASRHPGNKNVADAFEESQARIESMALVHETLSQSQDVANVDFESYVNKLVNYTFQSFGASRRRIQVEVQVEDVRLPMDAAAPCGLIIHELVSNCLEHAFKGRTGGSIRVSLASDPKGLVLAVSDNGVGLPRNLDVANPRTMGLRLVRILVKQLHGEMKVEAGKGTEFLIRFKI